MSKIKSSQLFSRQIPEYIRNEYPLFVDFIKAYYEFLDQTQSQDLEKIHDINSTLDDFVQRFKSEVAVNIPLDGIQDPREFLRHTREFYKSKGSEASYKFLFRTLFQKEIEMIYPSKQVLRASDGRWKQDISVFVDVSTDSGINPETSDQDLFQMAGGFATINTSKKSFITYIDRVVLYAGSIYEVFIQRDYSDEIEVGSTVSIDVDGITYSGSVLSCPSKISIFKAGAGFKPGDIFFLRTQKGRGCEIKVTKVGSNGEIRNIQILGFGLDYDTRFFSYLSSKDNVAYEYFHPILSDGYTEKTAGFIESGYALKQTYLAYDGNYGASADDNFFVEGDYVGEPLTQFYTNDTENPIDEDLAIIDIQLGAIAKYPGYYETQNGFISDEMYIHDGNYYQAFSYVIRVEEQLEKYASLIKSILHPAGMKLFAEYKISRDLLVSFEEKRFYTLLQLPYPGYTPSEAITSDYGLAGILNIGKYLETTYDVSEIYPTKFIEKPLYSDVSEDSKTIKHVYKPRESSVDALFTYQYQDILKPLFSSVYDTQIFIKDIEKPLYASVDEDSQTIKDVYKPRESSAAVESKLNSKDVEKPIYSTIDLIYTYIYDLEKPLYDSYNLESLTVKHTHKPAESSISADQSISYKDFEKATFDSTAATDITIRDIVFGNIPELISLTYNVSKDHEKSHSDVLNEIIDHLNKIEYDKTIEDTISALGELNYKDILKELTSSSTVNEDIGKALERTLGNQDLTVEDLIFIVRMIYRFSEVNISFLLEAINTYKSLNDTVSAQNSLTKDIEKQVLSNDSTINNNDNGVLRLNPYDNENYFVSLTSYQPYTAFI